MRRVLRRTAATDLMKTHHETKKPAEEAHTHRGALCDCLQHPFCDPCVSSGLDADAPSREDAGLAGTTAINHPGLDCGPFRDRKDFGVNEPS